MRSRLLSKYRLIFLIIMLLHHYVGFSVVDETANQRLYLKLNTLTSDTAKLTVLKQILKSWNQTNFDSSLKYSNEILKIAQRLRSNLSIGEAFFLIGETYRDYGKFDSAITYFYKAQKILSKIEGNKIEPLFLSYYYLSGEANIKGNYSDAFFYAQEAFMYAEKSGVAQWLKRAYSALAENKAATGNVRAAIDLYKKSFAINSPASVKLDINNHIYMSSLYSLVQQPDSAIMCADSAIKLCNISERNFNYFYARLTKAGALMDIKKYRDALAIIYTDSTEAKSVGDAQYLGYSVFIAGNSELQLKNYIQAHAFLSKAMDYANQIQIVDLQEQVYRSLEQYHAELNHYREAYEFAKKANNIRDSLHTIEKDKTVAGMQLNFDLERKNKELSIAESKHDTNIKLLWTSAIIIIVFLVLICLLYVNIYRRKKLNQALETSNHSKDRLISMLSHDLRSPIASLYVQLEADSAKLPLEFDQSAFKSIRQKLSNNLTMLDNILFWSAGQLHGFKPVPKNFYISDVIEEASTIYQHHLTSKNISLSNQVNPEEMLYADEQMFILIFRNLIQNAVKFTSSGGKIVISSAEIKEEYCIITISDNGVGIAAEKITHLFNGGETSRGTDGEKGTGVGLNLCKTLVELNGGEISIKSQIGLGTEVSIDMPLVS